MLWVTVLLALLAASLFFRAAVVVAMIGRYRSREGVRAAYVHAGLLAGAGLLSAAAATRTRATLYLVLACAIVMAADIVLTRRLAGRDDDELDNPA
jgi:hypothetical protein